MRKWQQEGVCDLVRKCLKGYKTFGRLPDVYCSITFSIEIDRLARYLGDAAQQEFVQAFRLVL